jgi:ubiquinone/menaquinone biosynthesis C-methylase UbiE
VERSGANAPAGQEQGAPSARLRLMGRAINATVARAPVLWPLLRAPTRRLFDRAAAGWDRRDRNAAEYLAAIAAGLMYVRPEPERALDIGTGTGAAALLIAREFPRARVRGVDISEEMVRRATERTGLDPEGRIAFRVGDASQLPWDDESFDLVAQLNMPPFFKEISRVLRPGGHAVVASSWGRRTPFWTPDKVLRKGFKRHGMKRVESGGAGAGTFFVARLPE